MPTPIEHLAIAEQILASPPASLDTWLDAGEASLGAFFFGHIAADVQAINDQPREATHFYTVPPTNERPAHERLLEAHPKLAHAYALPPAQAAFLSGYLAHLLLDERWVRRIFPVFVAQRHEDDWRERLLLHNVLRAWLDHRARPYLREDIGHLLRQAEPEGWLPFVSDADLRRWRDLVADQLEPGAAPRTVEIFARRAHISSDRFAALLEPKVMQERIFSRVSLATLDAFHARALDRSRSLVVRYLDGCAAREFQ